MTYTSDDFRKAADETFAKLQVVFQDKSSINFWQLGHSFDTIIDYFQINPAPASTFGSIAQSAYDRSINSSKGACWYDDYGWWGIAALKAQHTKLFPNNDFSSIVENCWNMMHDNAPNVWANPLVQSEFPYMQPRFDGGVWNFLPTNEKIPNPCGRPLCAPLRVGDQDCDPTKDTLCAIQNTVTNGLYLVLAVRLTQANPTNSVYRDAANREYVFLDKWFSLDDSDQESLLARPAFPKSPDTALVRERVSTFGVAYPDQPYYSRVCGYDPAQAWAGDQGLILGGLVDLVKMPGNAANNPTAPTKIEELLELAKQIATGVLAGAESPDNKGILPAWITGQNLDPCDYNTGIGIYMRYLLYVYQNNDDMKTYLQTIGYPDFVRANAEHVISNPGPNSTCNEHCGPPDCQVVGLTNDLATLVAAIAMSQ